MCKSKERGSCTRKKKDFHLGGMKEEGESKDCHLQEDTKRLCARAKKEEAAQERKRRECSQEGAVKRKRKQPREYCAWRRK